MSFEETFHVRFVARGRFRRIGQLAENAMNLSQIRGEALKHGFVDHAEVALSLIGRHMPLVPKKEMSFRPRNVGAKILIRGQQSVEAFGRRTTRKRDCYIQDLLMRLPGAKITEVQQFAPAAWAKVQEKTVAKAA